MGINFFSISDAQAGVSQAGVSLMDLPSAAVKNFKSFGHWIIATPPSKPELTSVQKFVRVITFQKEEPVVSSWNTQRLFTVAGRSTAVAAGATIGAVVASGAAACAMKAIGSQLKDIAPGYKVDKNAGCEEGKPGCVVEMVDTTLSTSVAQVANVLLAGAEIVSKPYNAVKDLGIRAASYIPNPFGEKKD